ncbi:hypothetical protein RLW55_03195 [Hyphomicrobium sp. B1]|uniref:hypothetical protein n=1 Tax=Hyphomicrobium sp. B1 TaxID=3075651 RepID=UPI003C2AC04E
MNEKITRVEHRHSDQKEEDSDLVLVVGAPLPSFYQIFRRPGLIVRSIQSGDPVICTLSDGDQIYIGKGNVRSITFAS